MTPILNSSDYFHHLSYGVSPEYFGYTNVVESAAACRRRGLISGSRLEKYELCALLGCYTLYDGNSLPTFN
jgi:hypothetical protein